MPGPSPPPPIKPLSEMSRLELVIDLVLLTTLVGGGLALLVAGGWALFTRPGQMTAALAAAAVGAVGVGWLSSVWVGRLREWRRRSRGTGRCT